MKKKKRRILTCIVLVVVAVALTSIGIGVSHVRKERLAQQEKEERLLKEKEAKKEEERLLKEKEEKEAKEKAKQEEKAKEQWEAFAKAQLEEQQRKEKEEKERIQALQTPPTHTGDGIVVCIDPGHQARGDGAQEPNGPGSSTMKARVTGGTRGVATGVSEYQLTLVISQQLRDELQRRGYTVYMTRESHDVNISNKERAEYATSVGANITIRIHANGVDNSSVSGALALAPSTSNPYVSHLAAESQRLSSAVLSSYCAATGLANQGVSANDTMTGINFCTMPVTILEMGYMTNPNDDTNMENAGFQQQMVTGIANGIDTYFGR